MAAEKKQTDFLLWGNRIMSPDADDRILHFGKQATAKKRLDLRFYGTASTEYVEWKASADTLKLKGGVGDRQIGGLVYKNTAASTAVTNTTTETNFDTNFAITASKLTAGSVLRVRWQGIATATNGTDTLTIKLKLGSTVAFATGAIDVANNDIFAGQATLIFRTVGASGTVVGAAIMSDPGAEGVTAKARSLASTAVDTTAALTVAVSATWSVANAGNSCRLDVFEAEIIQA